MEVRLFPRKIEIGDLGHFVRYRLSETLVRWPDQSIALLGYMCHPNDEGARGALTAQLWRWGEASEFSPPSVPPGLGQIQHDWLRVADIFHLYYDLAAGGHQERRGGPSIGKAIALIQANA